MERQPSPPHEGHAYAIQEKDKDKRFKSSEKVDEKEWIALEKEEGLHNWREQSTDNLPFCERPFFEAGVGLAIVANALFIALELDLCDKSASNSERLPWMVVDWVFCSIFIIEMGIRIKCLGVGSFCRQKKYLFDVVLVSTNLVDIAIQLAGAGTSGLQSLSALRILRVLRIFKMVRVVNLVEELHLIVVGLLSAVQSLKWVALLLGLVVFVMAIMLKILVGHGCDEAELRTSFSYHFGDAVDPTTKCEEYWGTVFRCMYTLYQVTTLESWSQVIARPIWDVKPHYMVLILGFQFLTTFGLLNIVVAAVVDGTMNSSDEFVVESKTMKETVSHLEILRDVFIEAAGPDNKVTSEQLIPVLLNPVVRRRLLTMNIAYDDPKQIFRILDAGATGSIGITDFTRGFMRMRGPAKAKDLLAVRALVYRCQQETVSKLDSHVTKFEKKIETEFETFAADTHRKLQQLFDGMTNGTPSKTEPKQVVEMPKDRNDRDFQDQIRRFEVHIDNLVAMVKFAGATTKGLESNYSAASSAHLLVEGPKSKPRCWNEHVTSTELNGAFASPMSMSIALQECHRQECSRQLVQLQQEFQTLQQWLASAGPRDEQRWTHLPPKGDRPLGEDSISTAPSDGRSLQQIIWPPPERQGAILQNAPGASGSCERVGRVCAVAACT